MPITEQLGPDCLLRVKAVPGARANQISGPLGDRLKVRVAAPPEGGKANKAIIALLAKALALKPRDITIEAGHTSPEKTIRITNARADRVAAALSLP